MKQFSILITGPHCNFSGFFHGTEAEAIQFIQQMNIVGTISLSEVRIKGFNELIFSTQNFSSDELDLKWHKAKEKEIRKFYDVLYNEKIENIKKVLNDECE